MLKKCQISAMESQDMESTSGRIHYTQQAGGLGGTCITFAEFVSEAEVKFIDPPCRYFIAYDKVGHKWIP